MKVYRVSQLAGNNHADILCPVYYHSVDAAVRLDYRLDGHVPEIGIPFPSLSANAHPFDDSDMFTVLDEINVK